SGIGTDFISKGFDVLTTRKYSTVEYLPKSSLDLVKADIGLHQANLRHASAPSCWRYQSSVDASPSSNDVRLYWINCLTLALLALWLSTSECRAGLRTISPL